MVGEVVKKQPALHTEVILRPHCTGAQHAGTYRLLLLLGCDETEEGKERG